MSTTHGADARVLKELHRFCAFCSAMAVGFGVTVLMGWIFKIPALKNPIPGAVTVKANTAACLVMLGVALWLLREGQLVAAKWSIVAKVLASAMSLVGLASLLEMTYGLDFGIDHLIVHAGPDDAVGSLRPGLMSPVTAVAFILLGMALVLLDGKTWRSRWPIQGLAGISALTSMFGILDVALEPRATHTYVSPGTAVVIFVLSLAVLCARTECGLPALLASGTLGGTIARRLLPASLVIPMLLGWLRWRGAQAGLYSDWVGVTIMVVSAATMLSVIVVWTALAIERSERERIRAQEASSRLGMIVTCSNEAIIGQSLDGTVLSWNPAAERVYGYSAEEMIGRNISALIPPDRIEELHNTLGKIREGEQLQAYESVRIRKDGRHLYVSLAVAAIRDSSGKLVGASTIARDITEQKRAEEALRSERQRFSSVLDHLPVYVVLLTPDYHVAFDNTMFRERFGESQGRRCYEYLFGRSEPCEICETYKTLKSNAPQRWKWTGPDGRQYDIFDFPFNDTDGSPLILEMGLDVTEQERAEAEVRRLNDQLEQRVLQRTAELEAANKELEAFTYSVSHDLRAPLRHISGFSKILVEEFGSAIPAEAQSHVQRIQDGTRRMGQLVDDLLNLARVSRHELRLQVAGLNSIVDEVVAGLKNECEGRNIGWNIGTLPYVDCDPALVKQVFQNLLSNAVKFTRPRAQAMIEVGQTQRDGAAVVYIRDNGVGFSMKYVDKLFGVFQRLHRPEDFEGTGVGLATVQRIIHKHGGRIWAEGELDKGAIFYFTLGAGEQAEAKTKAKSVGGST